MARYYSRRRDWNPLPGWRDEKIKEKGKFLDILASLKKDELLLRKKIPDYSKYCAEIIMECDSIYAASMKRYRDQSLFYRLFNRHKLTDDEKVEIATLRVMCADLQSNYAKVHSPIPYITDFDKYRAEVEVKIQRISDEIAKDVVREIKQNRMLEQKARYASFLETGREGADVIRAKLPRHHRCPYCNGPLGSSPHADHIYPVSKGGRSTPHNMVYICARCNNRKGNQTLTGFAAVEGLDLHNILNRLRELKKDC
jgi:5-methylcytosine-specific restriction endonuclease McrA